ncbi:MAG: hypothetical protein H7338_07180 [Candidatus Sericytochromatia bacterium]|nr:hypothetical protein [Candidatus Sericytochromatia bacterium]
MVQVPKHFTARQLLGFLEREVILRGRLPLFSELAYRNGWPPIDSFLDLLGDGDWAALQSGVSAWLGAKGYAVDREFNLVARLPPPNKSVTPLSANTAKEIAKSTSPLLKKKSPPLRRRTLLHAGELVEHDWSKLAPEALATECGRSIDRRFPPTSAHAQQMVGHKLVLALIGMLSGQTIGFEDGRNLIRTLLCLLYPEAAQNQLTVLPMFWREDPLGGLIAKAGRHLYGDKGLMSVAEAVEQLRIDYTEMADRLTHNELTLVFTDAYMVSRAEVEAFGERRCAPAASP